MQKLKIRTSAREELLDITEQIEELVADVTEGVIHLWSMHTTCALTVNEGADPDVRRDMVAFMKKLVPQDPSFRHAEGNSDSHVKTSLFGPGLTLLIEDGQLILGQWQHVYLAEWDGPRVRTIAGVIVPGVT